jgi:hypothetical protein
MTANEAIGFDGIAAIAMIVGTNVDVKRTAWLHIRTSL